MKGCTFLVGPPEEENDGRGSCNLEEMDEIGGTGRDDGRLEGRDDKPEMIGAT